MKSFFVVVDVWIEICYWCLRISTVVDGFYFSFGGLVIIGSSSFIILCGVSPDDLLSGALSRNFLVAGHFWLRIEKFVARW